jgi:hypothetical protein
VGVIETYTKRQKRLVEGEAQDVFTYDVIPRALRVQICHLWFECLGKGFSFNHGDNPAYSELHRLLAEEFGMFRFPDSSPR